VGIGRLTSEAFASGPNQSLTGSDAYSYDVRGRTTGWTMSIGGASYPFSLGYNDADQPTTLTYPDGDLLTTSYSSQGWLAGVTEKLGSTTNALLNTISYSGTSGAAGLPSSATIANGTDSWSSSYNAALRLTDLHLQQGSTVLFDQSRYYDAVGNTLTTLTTLPAGTDHQAFCYDDLDRLTWAGAEGTPPCMGLTEGTLTSAAYQQSYSYDVLDRFTAGPSGSGYTYGDANHIDAVTSAPNYSASYDAAGEMTSRNGQVLGYDALQRLISWQNSASNPTSTASYGYDGAGERVEQQTTTNGTTTTTYYIGPFEEITTTGSSTTTTKYYNGGVTAAVAVNGALSYLVRDGLGSVVAALDSSGNVTATQLYLPYGDTRYSSGSLPTSYGFTGQRSDPSGLLYDQARYYDPTSGAFLTPDDTDGSCYVYVHDNPESESDPSGHGWWSCSQGRVFRAYMQRLTVLASLFNQLFAAAAAKGLIVSGAAENPLIDIAETFEYQTTADTFGGLVNKAAAQLNLDELAQVRYEIELTFELMQRLCGDDPGAGLGAKPSNPRGGGGGPNTPIRGDSKKSQSPSRSSRPGKGGYFGQVYHHETKEEMEFMHINDQQGGTIPGVGFYDPLATQTPGTSGGGADTCDILCWIGIGLGIGISVVSGFHSNYQPAAPPAAPTTPSEDVNGQGTDEGGGNVECAKDGMMPCQA
jgi:RHS repeat-associated protein